MDKKQRYEVRIGKFGYYFYDQFDEYELPLDTVKELLNQLTDDQVRWVYPKPMTSSIDDYSRG